MSTRLNVRLFVALILIFFSSYPLFAYSVLWDISHGVASADYIPSTNGGFYQDFATELQNNNFDIQTTATGFTNENLAVADVAVVCAATSYSSLYTQTEIDELVSYVSSGKGLLIMGDYDRFNNYFYQGILQAFGISLSEVIPGGFTATDFAMHPASEGIDDIYMYYGMELDITGTAQSVATYAADENSESIIAASVLYGQGQVFALGDSSLWSITSSPTGINDYFHQADNPQFSINVFEHLVDTEYIPEPTTTMLMVVGSVILRRKGKR